MPSDPRSSACSAGGGSSGKNSPDQRHEPTLIFKELASAGSPRPAAPVIPMPAVHPTCPRHVQAASATTVITSVWPTSGAVTAAVWLTTCACIAWVFGQCTGRPFSTRGHLPCSKQVSQESAPNLPQEEASGFPSGLMES